VQLAPAHATAPFAGAAQVWLHLPQLFGSFARSTQVLVVVQSVEAVAEGQMGMQLLLAEQASDPLVGDAGHVTQSLLHSIWPCGQGWQIPALQPCPVAQAWPQLPQSAGAVLVLTSQPFFGLPSQSA
jgi:hypothetical protein